VGGFPQRTATSHPPTKGKLTFPEVGCWIENCRLADLCAANYLFAVLNSDLRFYTISFVWCAVGKNGEVRRNHGAKEEVNSALHPSGVANLTTSFGWGKGWNVRHFCRVAGSTVIPYGMCHANSSSGVANSVSELLYPCYCYCC